MLPSIHPIVQQLQTCSRYSIKPSLKAKAPKRCFPSIILCVQRGSPHLLQFADCKMQTVQTVQCFHAWFALVVNQVKTTA